MRNAKRGLSQRLLSVALAILLAASTVVFAPTVAQAASGVSATLSAYGETYLEKSDSDTFTVKAVVTNTGSKKLTSCVVTFVPGNSGQLRVGNAVQRISLKPGESGTVSWSVTATRPEKKAFYQYSVTLESTPALPQGVLKTEGGIWVEEGDVRTTVSISTPSTLNVGDGNSFKVSATIANTGTKALSFVAGEMTLITNPKATVTCDLWAPIHIAPGETKTISWTVTVDRPKEDFIFTYKISLRTVFTDDFVYETQRTTILRVNPLQVTVTETPASITARDKDTFRVSAKVTNIGSETLTWVYAELIPEDAAKLSAQGVYLFPVTLAPGASKTFSWDVTVKRPEQDQTRYSYSIYVGTPFAEWEQTVDRTVWVEDEEVRVTFMYNEDLVWETQEMLPGGTATLPEEPTRFGYAFKGWYVDDQLESWFAGESSPQVTRDVTLYAKWEPLENAFIFGRDTFGFENWGDSNSKDDIVEVTYAITGRYLLEMQRQILAFDPGIFILNGLFRETIFDETMESMEAQAVGSCAGMTAVALLMYEGYLKPDFFQTGATCVNKLTMPYHETAKCITNRTVFNLINYYQNLHFLNGLDGVGVDFDTENETPNNRALIEKLRDTGSPVAFSMDIYERATGKKKGGHFVLAYSYFYKDGEYVVEIYDPNEKDEPIYFYVSEDFTTGEFRETYDSEKYWTFSKGTDTAEEIIERCGNIQQKLKDGDCSTGAEGNAWAGVIVNTPEGYIHSNLPV